ncbi:hypothetical protein ACQKLP_10735 [Chitinophaga sp. NPDC101104]|uniref:hypothetical protein n=1 Tax=Chitinophaga sp. NPDC101104 TaxID=3390561 RepID=UPI003CFFC794
MKKAMTITAATIGVFALGAAAREVVAFAQATDLYALHPTTLACTRIVTSTNVLATVVQKSVGGQQATIKSDGGTRYTLWEDNGCSTTAIKFVP